MKHFYFIAVMLVSSVFISCGDTEIIIPRNEGYTNDTIPSFIVDAVNNAKLICDSIGEIKEVHRGTDNFSFKDEHGNTVKTDVFGNTQICINSNDTINIDYTVKEYMGASNDSICNTNWGCLANYSMCLNDKDFSALNNEKYKAELYEFLVEKGAKYEETTYCKERVDTIYEQRSCLKLNCRNQICVLNTCDTIIMTERLSCDKCKRIKVPNQLFDYKGNTYFIANYDGVLKVHETINCAEIYSNAAKYEYDRYIYEIPLDVDETFSIVEEAGKETIKEKVISTDVRKKHEAYNYRRLQDGRICIYNHDKKYYDDGHLGFKFPYVLNDTTKWLDVKFTKEYE